MIRFPKPAVWYRQATVGLALIILAGTGCSAEHFSTEAWKAIAQESKAEFKLGKVTFDQTGASDQIKQNDVIDSLAAKGYNAFGISAVATTHINSVFEDLKAEGFAVGSLATGPAGETDSADFCLS